MLSVRRDTVISCSRLSCFQVSQNPGPSFHSDLVGFADTLPGPSLAVFVVDVAVTAVEAAQCGTRSHKHYITLLVVGRVKRNPIVLENSFVPILPKVYIPPFTTNLQ